MGLDLDEPAERRFAEARGAWSDEEADRFVEELAEIWAGWPQAVSATELRKEIGAHGLTEDEWQDFLAQHGQEMLPPDEEG